MSGNDQIVMNYPMVSAMAHAMGEGSKQLEASIGEMNKVVSLLEDGGLRGDAGEAFTEAIRATLVPSMQRLQEKFEELQKDLYAARFDMMKADKQSAQGHRS